MPALKQKAPKGAKENVAVAAIQLLFVSARAWDIQVLVRELKRMGMGDIYPEGLVLSLVDLNIDLNRIGLEVIFHAGRVELSTVRITHEKLSDYLSSMGAGSPRITPVMWEVLAIIAFKGPVIAAEVTRLCGVDRAEVLARLDAMGLIERRSGCFSDIYVTTPLFTAQLGGADALEQMRGKMS
jgi:chromosome segregation and condensation protein ScpB